MVGGSSSTKIPWGWIGTMAGLAVIVMVIWGLLGNGGNGASATQTALAFKATTDHRRPTTATMTDTPIPIPLTSLTPNNTPVPTVTPTLTRTPTPAGPAARITDEKGVTMVLVPAGEFQMGGLADTALAECQKFRGDCQRSWFTNEEPAHKVRLDDFYFDLTEVTNAMYALCVQAGGCTGPQDKSSSTRSSYYGNAQYENYPVIHVDWNQAKAYCAWRGAGLPTEAQWEKAARGTDGRLYPWGNQTPDCSLANFYGKNNFSDHCVGDTSAVGSYPSGASLYGALDMAGNAWEWALDWYSETYYASSPGSNPSGPSSGTYRVVRGGAWYDIGNDLRSANRGWYDPTFQDYFLGFRCSRSP